MKLEFYILYTSTDRIVIKVIYKLRNLQIGFKPENMTFHEMMLQYSMKSKYGRSKFLYVLLQHLSDIFNFT